MDQELAEHLIDWPSKCLLCVAGLQLQNKSLAASWHTLSGTCRKCRQVLAFFLGLRNSRVGERSLFFVFISVFAVVASFGASCTCHQVRTIYSCRADTYFDSPCSSGYSFDDRLCLLCSPFCRVWKVAERKCPEFFEFSSRILPRILLRIFPNFLRIFCASFRGKRRPERIHQKSPPFFNAKFPGKHEKNIR